jgi:hypothetical protein
MLNDLSEITHVFAIRGDLAHLALLLWAACASLMLYVALRELGAANRRLNDFVDLVAGVVRREGE